MILLTINILRSDYFDKNLSEETIDNVIQSDIKSVLRILEIYNIKCTFFCETQLLQKFQALLKLIVQKGHELSIFNLNTELSDFTQLKKITEDFLEKNIRGVRQQNFKLEENDLKLAEISYISNIEYGNAHLPFKKLTSETTIIEKNGISYIPECVSPYSHFPYNDLLFQLSPQHLYNNMVLESLKKNDFVLIYLNAFQFTDRKYFLKLPFFRKLNTGKKMEDKLSSFLEFVNEKDIATARIKDFVF